MPSSLLLFPKRSTPIWKHCAMYADHSCQPSIAVTLQTHWPALLSHWQKICFYAKMKPSALTINNSTYIFCRPLSTWVWHGRPNLCVITNLDALTYICLVNSMDFVTGHDQRFYVVHVWVCLFFLWQWCFLCVSSLLIVLWQHQHSSFLVWHSCGKMYSDCCVGVPCFPTAIPGFQESGSRQMSLNEHFPMASQDSLTTKDMRLIIRDTGMAISECQTDSAWLSPWSSSSGASVLTPQGSGSLETAVFNECLFSKLVCSVNVGFRWWCWDHTVLIIDTLATANWDLFNAADQKNTKRYF